MDNGIEAIQNIDMKDVWQGKKSGVEENVKIKIVLPLLQSLGFNPAKDMDFEHFVENKRADIAILIDGKPKIVVECKSPEKNLDDAISQALNYAIKQQIPYILLTNGIEFRLYKPFIENLVNPEDRLLAKATLQTLVKEYPDLSDWISYDSLTKDRIDKKAKKIIEERRDAITAKTLIENLREAKQILIDDAKTKILPKFKSDTTFRDLVDKWVKDSELDIAKPDKWVDILANEIAYSFINKLYFYRIAEDKKIVAQKLNKQAMKGIPKWLGYEDMVKLSFAEIRKIDYAVIFDHDIFDMIEFDERNLKKIVDSLSEYNFASISSDIIGKIYEYHVTKEERKRLGQFYTPPEVINYIFDNIPLRESDKLIDPACGSGGFLIRAYDRFLKVSKDKKKKNLHKQIIENNLFGYDINPFAVHMTGMNLALRNIEDKTDVINVTERDSLTRDAYSQKFNVVIGNPPYFNLNQDIIKKQYAGEGFEQISSGVVNIASLFLKKYISQLEPAGYLGFVLPKSITYTDSWEGIRKYVLEEAEIVKIFDIHEAFDGVLLEEVVLIVRKKPCDKLKQVEVTYIELPYTKDNETAKHMVDSSLFNKTMFPIYLFSKNKEILDAMNKDIKLVGDISEPVFRGSPIQKFEYLFTDKKVTPDDLPILRGANIDQFALKDKIQYVSWKRTEFKAYEKSIKRLQKPKIMGQRLIAQTGNHMKMIATIDEKGEFLEVDTINNVILKDNSFNLKYVLGIINSKLASYYMYNFIFNRAVRTVDFGYVSKLPIKVVPHSKQQKVIDLVDKLLKEDTDSSNAKDLRDKIDEEVYAIYGIKPKEIDMIERDYK